MRSSADVERVAHDGERIVQEGDHDRRMFIVASGRVRIAKQTTGGDITLGYVERGDFFGDMALLESLPRFASAYAVGETRLVVIEPGGLLLRIRRDPTFAIQMLHQLSSRLRGANTRLLEALERAGAQEDDDAVIPVWEVGGAAGGAHAGGAGGADAD